MKTFIALIVAASFCSALTACGQQPTPAQIAFHVITDEGKPVEGADVWVSTFARWQPGEGFGRDIASETHGKTDKDGNVTITFQCVTGELYYGANLKPTHYDTQRMTYRFVEKKEGRWEPWSPTVELLLKPIVNPIAMYARKVGEKRSPMNLPALAQPVGFDLIESDWVAPHGRGKTADLVFKLERKFTSADQPFETTLTITFSNEGDGIQSVLAPKFTGSTLRLPRTAPEHGYAPEMVKHAGRPAADKPISTGAREDQNYFFRVRTVLDEKKQVKSALYGKILGDVRVDVINANPGYISFTYYLNPTPNERNVEYRGQSLVHDLRVNEQPDEP